ncbi:hypothetical protein D3C80_1721120 [compost metagenome]
MHDRTLRSCCDITMINILILQLSYERRVRIFIEINKIWQQFMTSFSCYIFIRHKQICWQAEVCPCLHVGNFTCIRVSLNRIKNLSEPLQLIVTFFFHSFRTVSIFRKDRNLSFTISQLRNHPQIFN